MRRLLLFVALLLVMAPAAAAAPAGDVRLLEHADSGFDWDLVAALGSTGRQGKLRGDYTRMRAYAPFFDPHLSCTPTPGPTRTSTPSMATIARTLQPALRAEGRARAPLYIPWGCEGGTCPQFAGHPGDPRFRARWIAAAREKLAAGYRGLWVDDANLVPRVGDGKGKDVLPFDPRSCGARGASLT